MLRHIFCDKSILFVKLADGNLYGNLDICHGNLYGNLDIFHGNLYGYLKICHGNS